MQCERYAQEREHLSETANAAVAAGAAPPARVAAKLNRVSTTRAKWAAWGDALQALFAQPQPEAKA